MKGIMICTIRVVLSNMFNAFHIAGEHIWETVCFEECLFFGGIIYHVQ